MGAGSVDAFTCALDSLKLGNFRLFRGQRRDVPLIPKIGRDDLKVLCGATSIEAVERSMMDRFKREAHPFFPVAQPSEWDLLAIAQHHGMATRLLDWTLNPLIALWFACVDPLNTGKKRGNAVVWVFCPDDSDFMNDGDNPYSGERTKVFRPRHISERIRAQAGCFTVHKYDDKRLGFVPFENIGAYRSKLAKIEIEENGIKSIREKLNSYGVNEALVFPGLEGLCRHIQWQHSSAVTPTQRLVYALM
jgi:hypothetical protein